MPGLAILHEDRDIIVVDKAPGLLTIAAADDQARTAYRFLTDHVRKGCARSRERIFIVHRLDRDTSGVLVFAKSEGIKRQLQDHWEDVRKTYLAVVHGTPAESQGMISSYLAENRALRVYSTHDKTKGKLARTAWRLLQTNGTYSLLEVDLLTGRKHQIRVHLSEAGLPIVGDPKYGPSDAASKLLALHAFSMTFKHPFSGEKVVYEAPVPHLFSRLMGRAYSALLPAIPAGGPVGDRPSLQTEQRSHGRNQTGRQAGHGKKDDAQSAPASGSVKKRQQPDAGGGQQRRKPVKARRGEGDHAKADQRGGGDPVVKPAKIPRKPLPTKKAGAGRKDKPGHQKQAGQRRQKPLKGVPGSQ